jgi:HEAT repeat protein
VKSSPKKFVVLFVCFVLPALIWTGCAKGPLWRTGYVSPWARKIWSEEQRVAQSLISRKEDLRAITKQANSGTAYEQEQAALRLTNIIKSDPILLLRIEAVELLGKLKTDAALTGLKIASNDPEPDIRMAAINAWQSRGDDVSIKQLQSLVASDTNLDVRLSATRALGSFTDPQAARALAVVLDDPNPAVQFRATKSLGKVTGESFGANVSAWRQFLTANLPNEDVNSKGLKTNEFLNEKQQADKTGNKTYDVQQTSGQEDLKKFGGGN